MLHTTARHLKTGGDPRTLSDYSALRDELAKLSHPARPDVDWAYAERLCMSLFEHNGVELRTAAWYTLARTHTAGLPGLNEGLAVLEALIIHQWGAMWPQPVHARIEILAGLSPRLQQRMRTLTLHYADLKALYQAEHYLTAIGDALQRLELRHASQLDGLRTQLHNAAVRLEAGRGVDGETTDITLPVHTISGPERASDEPEMTTTPWIFVAQPEPKPKVTVISARQPTRLLCKPFAAGMLIMLVLSSAALCGWRSLHQPDPLGALTASLTLPEPLTAAQRRALPADAHLAEAGLHRTRQQLVRLSSLPPDWPLRYGSDLVQQAQTLWPIQAKPLAQQWQNQLNATALTQEKLNGWHQGMTQLQHLTDRLNALDERRGRYITGSELKTMVFSIMQSFNSAVPAEEQLRQLTLDPAGAAQKREAETALNALLNRYTLLAGPAVVP
ncbi:VasL domain-containing protein [Siccibacter turicensis]|uniref:VasL domain-containing protein n=1 Tax=Siccibacter turicensis TaxID=357233 RepID=UPI000466C2A0|nr:VasL domain-containing protein [Siccibacter turicensis]